MKVSAFILLVVAALPGWALYVIVMTPLVLFGFVLIPIALICSAFVPVKGARFSTYAWRWRWMDALYGNREDGIDGAGNGFWRHQAIGPDLALQIFRWSAWRNSVGNARWLPFFGMTVDPRRVRSLQLVDGPWLEVVKTGPYLAWQGWRFELKFSWNAPPDWRKRRIFWIGWRMAQQTVVTDAVGFAFQPWSSLA